MGIALDCSTAEKIDVARALLPANAGAPTNRCSVDFPCSAAASAAVQRASSPAVSGAKVLSRDLPPQDVNIARWLNPVAPTLVQGRSRRISQRNQLSRRIVARSERSIWVGVDNPQHFAAANSADGKALTLHSDDSIFFTENCRPGVPHNQLDALFQTVTPPYHPRVPGIGPP